MDEQSRKTLDEILAKESAALTDADKGFMRARRSYLTEEQKAVFADVLAEAPADDVSEDVEAAKPRKGRKVSDEA